DLECGTEYAPFRRLLRVHLLVAEPTDPAAGARRPGGWIPAAQLSGATTQGERGEEAGSQRSRTSAALRQPRSSSDRPIRSTTSPALSPRARRSRRVTAPSRLAPRAPAECTASGTCADPGWGSPSRSAR